MSTRALHLLWTPGWDPPPTVLQLTLLHASVWCMCLCEVCIVCVHVGRCVVCKYLQVRLLFICLKSLAST